MKRHTRSKPRQPRQGIHKTAAWGLLGFGVLLMLDSSTTPMIGRPLWAQWLVLLVAILLVGFGIWFYAKVVMVRWAERQPTELTAHGFFVSSLGGLGIGFGLMALSAFILIILGFYRVDGFRPFGVSQILTLGVLACASVFEELIMRGVALHALDRWLGWVPALILTSLLFGFMHALNPGATLFSCLAIAIEAGLMLGSIMVSRHNLWICIGFHIGWNLTEALLGIPVSGQNIYGFMVMKVQGPTLLTGGSFGIEASLIPVILGLLVSAAFLLCRGRDTMIGSRT